MPTTRPDDKGKDRSDWWRGTPPPEGDIPEGPAANNKDNAGKNKFEEEQLPTRHPGD
jgi:hypothetical protein